MGMVGHAWDGVPDEACGLLVGKVRGDHGWVTRFEPTANDARSARVYTIPPLAHLRIERAAEEQGLAVIGVVHSHTHTEAYPSPTDVAQAPDPEWHYVIVSLRDEAPVTRSFRILDGVIAEEQVVVDG
jgi:[CysO sulfur-carrier protein]-S-L-cysteine hydrolase